MGDGMRKVASLSVAVAVSLAATSQLALGGDKRPKQSGNASCMQLTYGCLTCADGPCVIQTCRWDVSDDLSGIGLAPAPIEALGRQAELYEEIAR